VPREQTTNKQNHGRNQIRKNPVRRILSLRANIRTEYRTGSSRVFCEIFSGVASHAKIYLLPVQTVDLCAGQKKAGRIADISVRITALGDSYALVIAEVF
jgi:hypothetical protein